MSSGTAEEPAGEATAPEGSSTQRRRREQVFGDVLPEASSDDRPDTWGDAGGADPDGAEEWLRRQVPPHHG